MNLDRLHYIITIAEERSLSRAAQKLYISQPALTKHLNTLETDLGVTLFDRSRSPISLTYAGEIYVDHAKRILSIEAELSREMEELADMRKGRLSIGITSTRGCDWLPHILPTFMKRYPGIEIKLYEGGNSDFYDMLSKGQIDIAICPGPITPNSFAYEVICEEQVLLFAAATSSLFNGIDLSNNDTLHPVQLDPQQLSNQPFIQLPHGFGIYRISEQIMNRYNIHPETIIETINVDTAFALAAEGIGLAFCPDVCYTMSDYKTKPICCTIDNPPFVRQVVALYRKDIPLSKVKRQFIDLTIDVVRNELS